MDVKEKEIGMTREEELIRLIENCKMALARIGDLDKAEVRKLVGYEIELDRIKRNGQGRSRIIGP